MEQNSNTFKMPIEYTNFIKTDNCLLDDLELDCSNNIYSILMQPTNNLGQKMISNWSSKYTTNSKHLKSTQKFIKSIHSSNIDTIQNTIQNINSYHDKWNNVRLTDNFNTTFQFIDWKHIEFLNSNPFFLQLMSYFNFASPLFHILMPVFILILPFFILKIVHNTTITFDNYKKYLFSSLQSHAFGQFFNAFCDNNSCNTSFNTKLYAVFSVLLYLFSFYQNILSCIKFYNNASFIHSFMNDTKIYVDDVKELYTYLTNIKNSINSRFHSSYISFYQDLEQNYNYTLEIASSLSHIKSDKFTYLDVLEFGISMHKFHTLFNNNTYIDNFNYWFECSAFIDNIFGIVNRLDKKQISFATFESKKNKKQNPIIMKNLYYINHIDNNTNDIVTNNINLSTNTIITGPNASGKTTLLKSVCINILLSQQLGIGCFSEFKCIPYNRIYSYINIPDTSGRDSLFQAEARKCLDIIHYKKNNPNHRCFCIYDELFSGTNPHEAQTSAISYLKYLQNNNIDFMLTTHFQKLSNYSNKNCVQKHMEVINKNNNFTYSYLVKNGSSKVFGGFKVLEDIGFPKEILDNLKEY